MENMIKITERPSKWDSAFCIAIVAISSIPAIGIAAIGAYLPALAIMLAGVFGISIIMLGYLLRRRRAEISDEKIGFFRGRKVLVAFRWDEVAEVARCYEHVGRSEYVEKLYVSEERMPAAKTDDKGRFLISGTVTSYRKYSCDSREDIKFKVGTLLWSEKLLDAVKKFYKGEIRFYFPQEE